MITGGGPGVTGARPAIVEKGVAKPTCPVSNRVGVGTVSSTIRGSLCPADIPKRWQPLRPGTGRTDWCLMGCAYVSTAASCSTATSARAKTSCIGVFADKLSGKASRNGQAR